MLSFATIKISLNELKTTAYMKNSVLIRAWEPKY